MNTVGKNTQSVRVPPPLPSGGRKKTAAFLPTFVFMLDFQRSIVHHEAKRYCLCH